MEKFTPTDGTEMKPTRTVLSSPARSTDNNRIGIEKDFVRGTIMKTLQRVGLISMVLCITWITPILAEGWEYRHEADPLHGVEYDIYGLAGSYAPGSGPTRGTAPAAIPRLTVVCANRKIWAIGLEPGVLVNASYRTGILGGWKTNLYVRIDNGKPGGLSDLMVSDNRQNITLAASDIGKWLSGKQVLLGVSEILAGEVVLQFDMPGIYPLMEHCGNDGTLKRLARGR